MFKQGKVWGSTQLVHKCDNFELHRLEIDPGMRCSKHCHKHKFNDFFVDSGHIKIYVWKNDYDLVDVTELKAGEKTTTKPGEYHCFEAVEYSVVYEFYYVRMDSNDIEREDHGGEA